MEEKKSRLTILTNGLIKENPVLVLLLGCCSALATSSTAINGLGMGVSFSVVMILSNIVISLLRKIIPDNVRIPCYSVYKSLGLFIPLIVVNCIILGRAEMFANKNGVIDSALDGIGMGLGYTGALVVMGMIREFIGSGTLFNIPILAGKIDGVAIFNLAPGGFFTFAILVAAVNFITRDKERKVRDFGEEEITILGAKEENEEKKGA